MPTVTSIWKSKHKTLKSYYANAILEANDLPSEKQHLVGQKKYPSEYYEFDKFQQQIDPDETIEEVEAYSKTRQDQETIKCAHSFPYWCHKYVKILHPMRGLIPFLLYKYQNKTIRDYENHRFNIISKFRQGGLTTVTLLWGLWRTLFKTDQQIMLLSKTDREATDIGMIIDRSIENFPSWMKPKKDGKWNDHLKQITETGGALKFYSPEAARGKSVTFLIIDEAAFIDDMETHWKAMWPILSTGGSCTLVSTVNGLGNWYEETFHGAIEGRNKFHVIELDYWEHPDYNDKEWVADQKAQLGERGFAQEVLRSFLGSGETYISAHILGELDRQTRESNPIRKRFRQWSNKATKTEDVEGVQLSEKEIDTMEKSKRPELIKYQRGALWIWREPIEGHEYIVGADVAEGMQENADNSAFQIIDCASLEQVGEFYSNSITPHLFAQILNEIGLYYNTALMVVEDMGAGIAVIEKLVGDYHYENMYFNDKNGRANKPGIKTTRINRPVILEAIQQRILTGTVRINSRRLIRELKTLEYNTTTRRAEAQKGKHDDAVMAMAMALYVRDRIMRDVPMGAKVSQEIMNSFQAQSYEDIKREIMDGAPSSWIEEEINFIDGERKEKVSNHKRHMDSLLREFGW